MGNNNRRGGFRGAFEYFVHSQVAGSVLLLACTIVALIWANSPWHDYYEHLLHLRISFSWADMAFGLSLHHWINDGLMVLFFFVVGLEIKRELVVGQLSTFRKAILPIAAALGGILIPALMYAMFNSGGAGAPGWGIPMATDIAFALGVLAVFGSRAPIGLKIFLTALAIADDLGAVLVIAIFYTEKIHFGALIVAGILLLILLVLVRSGFDRSWLLLTFSVVIWAAVFSSGLHATVAGILVAMVIPVKPRVGWAELVGATRRKADLLNDMNVGENSILHDQRQLDTVERLRSTAARALPPGLMMEHFLHPVQVWVVLPLFALANAGVHFDTHILETLASPIALGIMAGLVLGKPLGIVLATWLIVRIGWGSLPEEVNWGQILGVGCLAGIGFTMSLFVTALAFSESGLIADAKVGILAASLISGILGFVLLSRSLPKIVKSPKEI